MQQGRGTPLAANVGAHPGGANRVVRIGAGSVCIAVLEAASFDSHAQIRGAACQTGRTGRSAFQALNRAIYFGARRKLSIFAIALIAAECIGNAISVSVELTVHAAVARQRRGGSAWAIFHAHPATIGANKPYRPLSIRIPSLHAHGRLALARAARLRLLKRQCGRIRGAEASIGLRRADTTRYERQA